ncbi:hypothetical protein [Novosphingobium rosa]|uniref:hypothetical protein n=1 Tax=Novosphingobium rosa TaxID=76978 RepID=UPI000833226A|nr:hypothetical protein [Novosphingobium rosa]
MNRIKSFVALLALSAPFSLALPARQAIAAPAPIKPGFKAFFEDFRSAVLAHDRARVAGMVKLPFKDFSGGPVNRSAATSAQFIAKFDKIFTPAVVAAIRANKIRAFSRQHDDDGQTAGPLMKGEYLLDAPEILDQLVFSPQGGSFVLNRIPFYS